MPHDPAAARDVWRRLELVHSVSYFAPEAIGALTALGYKGFWMGYFAGRAAPLGAAGPELVGALFYNFTPDRVARALPEAWSIAGPDAALAARADGARAALARALADLAPAAITAAADLAATAARTAIPDGRALYAAHAGLPWPSEPLAVLWHAATLLREHRGDGHVALLTTSGLSGRECNVFQSAAGNVPREMIQRARDYDDDEWQNVVARLADRGLMTSDGALTDAGAALRQQLEDRTDELALAGYVGLDDAALARLTELLTPIAAAVVAAGDIPAATPMGPTLGA
jgi:Helix-turn-helix family